MYLALFTASISLGNKEVSFMFWSSILVNLTGHNYTTDARRIYCLVHFGVMRVSRAVPVAPLSDRLSPLCPIVCRPFFRSSVARLSDGLSPFCPIDCRPFVRLSVASLSNRLSPLCPIVCRLFVKSSVAPLSDRLSPLCPIPVSTSGPGP